MWQCWRVCRPRVQKHTYVILCISKQCATCLYCIKNSNLYLSFVRNLIFYYWNFKITLYIYHRKMLSFSYLKNSKDTWWLIIFCYYVFLKDISKRVMIEKTNTFLLGKEHWSFFYYEFICYSKRRNSMLKFCNWFFFYIGRKISRSQRYKIGLQQYR